MATATASVRDIRSALKILRPILTGNGRPILKCVLVHSENGGTVFTATDLEVRGSVVVEKPASAPVEPFCLDAKELGAALKGAKPKDRVSIDSDGTVRVAGFTVKVRADSADEFPHAPEFETPSTEYALAPSDVDSILRVSTAASVEPGRYAISGTFFRGTVVAATDGRRLATDRLSVAPSTREGGDIVPRTGIVALGVAWKDCRSDCVRWSRSGDRWTLRGYGWSLSGRFVEAVFPDYSAVENFARERIGELDEVGRLAHAQKLVEPKSAAPAVRVHVNGSFALTGPLGSFSVPCSTTRECSVTFNPEYLAGVVDALGAGPVTMESREGDPSEKCWTFSRGESMYHLMPVVVSA